MNTDLFFKILICIAAGAGAGIATGFAGLSAVAFISPLLVVLLKMPIYQTVTIGLASDILASLISAVTYHESGNIDLRHGKELLISTLVFTVLGSIAAFFITRHDVGDEAMSIFSLVSAFAVGVSYLVRSPEREQETSHPFLERIRSKKWVPWAAGAYIGSVCGLQGTGGGMMMLLILTVVMGFQHQTAVGTSVFIMTFIAAIGAGTHYAVYPEVDFTALFACVLSTLIFARLSAILGNRLPVKTLYRITGLLLALTGISMLVLHFWL